MHLLGGDREQPGSDRASRVTEREEVAKRDFLLKSAVQDRYYGLSADDFCTAM